MVERLDVATMVQTPTDEPTVAIPDTVDLGVAFPVTITTFGNSCRRKGHVESVVISGRPVLTPLDWITSGAPCEDILRTFDHTAEILLNQPGTAFVMARGRVGQGGPIQTFEWQLWVR